MQPDFFQRDTAAGSRPTALAKARTPPNSLTARSTGVRWVDISGMMTQSQQHCEVDFVKRTTGGKLTQKEMLTIIQQPSQTTGGNDGVL